MFSRNSYQILFIHFLVVAPILDVVSCECYGLRAQMSPEEFNTLLFTEAENELQTKSDYDWYWYDLTKEYWKNPPLKVIPQPYILCNFAKSSSAFHRRTIIEEMIMQEGTVNGSATDKVYVDKLPVYNSSEKTCYFVSLPWILARDIAMKSCCKNQDCAMQMQPLLPVMKLSFGTVDAATLAKPEALLNVHVKLSPYGATVPRKNTFFANLFHNVTDRSDEQCQKELILALPISGREITCSKNNRITTEHITTHFTSEPEYNSVFAFTIDLSDFHADTVHARILIFLTGLVIHPAIESIEIEVYDHAVMDDHMLT